MKKIWNNRWKKALIWLSGYLSFIAYAIVGGYVIVKSEDQELRKTAKTAFVVTLIFTAIGALQNILTQINNRSGYSAGFGEFLAWLGFFVMLAEIAVYATFIIMSLFGGSSEESASDADEQKKEVAKEDRKDEDKTE